MLNMLKTILLDPSFKGYLKWEELVQWEWFQAKLLQAAYLSTVSNQSLFLFKEVEASLMEESVEVLVHL